VLLRNAECGDRGVLAVGGLEAIGPAARAAVPLLRPAISLLRAAVDGDKRQGRVSDDEAWTDACHRALVAVAL
jgi:hypothetical protein